MPRLEGVVPIGCAGSNPADRTIPQKPRNPYCVGVLFILNNSVRKWEGFRAGKLVEFWWNLLISLAVHLVLSQHPFAY
jgi:hypothetical protein